MAPLFAGSTLLFPFFGRLRFSGFSILSLNRIGEVFDLTIDVNNLTNAFAPPHERSCAVQQFWDLETDLLSLGVRISIADIENTSWQRACQDLYRMWPTTPSSLESWPPDFPTYCQ